jgi:hypothetical protein
MDDWKRRRYASRQLRQRAFFLFAQEIRRSMMYYRVAIQLDPSLIWQWKSTALSSLDTLFQWLRLYRAVPQDHLRVFSSSSREDLDELLMRENNGGASGSSTAAQFLQDRMIGSREVVWVAAASGTQENKPTTSIAVVTEPQPDEISRKVQPPDDRGLSFLDKRRVELESGSGGDYDILYRFALPISMPQVLTWVKLLVRVQGGDLQP